MDLGPGGNGRLAIALSVFAALAAGAWFTMDSGKLRSLTLVLLGFFAVRTLLARARSG